MCPLFGRCPSPFLYRPLLLSSPRDGPLFRNFGAHRSQPRVGALRYAPFRPAPPLPTHRSCAFLSLGLYFALFSGCVKVLYNKRRRRGGGNHRLILVSTTLFVLITWVRCLPARSCFPFINPYSIWSSISFDCTLPSKGVRPIKERISTLNG